MNKIPTAKGRWYDTLNKYVPVKDTLTFSNFHYLDGFSNENFSGYFKEFEPESNVDLKNTYEENGTSFSWKKIDVINNSINFLENNLTKPWQTLFLYAEVESDEELVALLQLNTTSISKVWFNGQLVSQQLIPRPTTFNDDAPFVVMQKGKNTVLIKSHIEYEEPLIELKLNTLTDTVTFEEKMNSLTTSTDHLTSIMSKYTLVEFYALTNNEDLLLKALDDITQDDFATKWDIHWVESLKMQKEYTGNYLPIKDVQKMYEPLPQVKQETIWPQVQNVSKDLDVLDVSNCKPEEEFALTVLQGITNRDYSSLYLLHTEYKEKDEQWLEELKLSYYSTKNITIEETYTKYLKNIKGAVIYDGNIFEELGDYYSNQLNQTNIIMMICSLNDAIPLTEEMNKKLNLPVIFDARNKWQSQYDMTRWAYNELYPKMNQNILATNYPGIFYLMDYLVANKIFTFWFPENRLVPEENLLLGILASTPPNTPIIGWWFNWMAKPKDPNQRNADGVQEEGGMLRGSVLGKFLTPSHEATNLTVHSGVNLVSTKHKPTEEVKYDKNKTYFSFIISDGDNLGEALMMRTREIQWDRKERGNIPLGWSFAPATIEMAPSVFNYYMRTATKNDYLVGGLGTGYTEPMIYLRGFPFHRDELYKQYIEMTDDLLKKIDTTALWLINGGPEEEELFAKHSKGQLKSLYVGYGGSPETAQARVVDNDVVAFRTAIRKFEGKGLNSEQCMDYMLTDIKRASELGNKFIEAWVLNWDWTIEMLEDVCKILDDDFVCVRPDILAKLKLESEKE